VPGAAGRPGIAGGTARRRGGFGACDDGDDWLGQSWSGTIGSLSTLPDPPRRRKADPPPRPIGFRPPGER
jgi:hypothetical protein